MSQLTKASLICGGGSMIILVSILINLQFYIQILLLLVGLAISVYGVLLLVKMISDPSDKASEILVEQASVTTQKKKNRPTSTL
ncbi:hypothetical protein AEA09_02280 [Lysinibacillus contaminans]|uniref:Uncharacterized protein n=1 Tax=Lysinibacillus contaminans TaxID=1293441 RepID=A0ABR5K581_9BACI|nr:hypothetical protein [Lysinibacillus contaminans]KOS70341.1 hypothetical protein AEA09_02280 [Lysinibacillus contaminans]